MNNFLRPGVRLTAREKIRSLDRKNIKKLIRVAIEKYPSGFDFAMLKEPKNNMMDYILDLDDSILMQLVK